MFNVITAFKGSKGRFLTKRGIISLRHKYFKPFPNNHMIVVTTDEYTATYSLGELVTLFGLPPPTGKHRNYANLGGKIKPAGQKEALGERNNTFNSFNQELLVDLR